MSRLSNWFGLQHERHPWLGPLIFVSSALYFYAQIAAAWVFRPGYSVSHNTISDLGVTSCGRYGTPPICSPHWPVMSAGFIFLGAVMLVGSMLLYHEFAERNIRERRAALVGFTMMSLAGVGAALVGVFPENVNHPGHVLGAVLAIGVGNLAIFVLGAVLTLPEAMRRSMLLFSVTSLTALVLFACHKDFGVGPGLMERIAAYPVTIWLISFGLYVWRFHPRRRGPVASDVGVVEVAGAHDARHDGGQAAGRPR